jgi:glycosyltransferase involved in cell wall biosynthesis
MPTLLFLAYYLPPIGGAGVRRNATLVQHLQEFGYDLKVLTGPGTPDYRWTPLDDELTGVIPREVSLERIPAPEPARSTRMRVRAERWLRVPSAWERWWFAETTRRIRAARLDADVVHASVAPYPTAGAAVAIARELRKPLVVDFEDPWALDEMLVYPTSLHRRLDLLTMRRTLDAADAIVMNTPEAARRVRELFPELGAKPVVAIPNGFDRNDFDGPEPTRHDDVFRIVHTGSLHTDLGLRQRRHARVRGLLGGAVDGVDFLTRSHVHLLEAIDRLLARDPELRSRIEVHLAGVLTAADQEVAARSPVVRTHGFLPHRRTIELIRSADLLFLPMHDLPPGKRATVVPCKTYEYLASGRPILAAVPDGDARDALEAAETATLCRPNDVDEMTRIVEKAIRRRQMSGRAETRTPSVALRYESLELAGKLVSLYDSLLERSSGVTAPRRVSTATPLDPRLSGVGSHGEPS